MNGDIQKQIADRLVTLPGRRYYVAILPRDLSEPVEVEIARAGKIGVVEVVESYGNFTAKSARRFVRAFNTERLDVFGHFWV